MAVQPLFVSLLVSLQTYTRFSAKMTDVWAMSSLPARLGSSTFHVVHSHPQLRSQSNILSQYDLKLDSSFYVCSEAEIDAHSLNRSELVASAQDLSAPHKQAERARAEWLGAIAADSVSQNVLQRSFLESKHEGLWSPYKGLSRSYVLPELAQLDDELQSLNIGSVDSNAGSSESTSQKNSGTAMPLNQSSSSLRSPDEPFFAQFEDIYLKIEKLTTHGQTRPTTAAAEWPCHLHSLNVSQYGYSHQQVPQQQSHQAPQKQFRHLNGTRAINLPRPLPSYHQYFFPAQQQQYNQHGWQQQQQQSDFKRKLPAVVLQERQQNQSLGEPPATQRHTDKVRQQDQQQVNEVQQVQQMENIGGNQNENELENAGHRTDSRARDYTSVDWAVSVSPWCANRRSSLTNFAPIGTRPEYRCCKNARRNSDRTRRQDKWDQVYCRSGSWLTSMSQAYFQLSMSWEKGGRMVTYIWRYTSSTQGRLVKSQIWLNVIILYIINTPLSQFPSTSKYLYELWPSSSWLLPSYCNFLSFHSLAPGVEIYVDCRWD